MNIIFLDVDGVLNSYRKLMEMYKQTNKPQSGVSFPFDEICLNNLKILVEETNSKIVITSTWRKYKQNIDVLLDKFKEYNLDKKVIGYTPVLNKRREHEIIEFLIEYKGANFVIIDDIKDMGELNKFLVVTKYNIGLTRQNVDDAIKILKRS